MTTTPPTIDVRTLTAADYKAAKKEIVEAGYKTTKTPPTTAFDKNRLSAEIEAFQAAGKVSPFSSTSSTSAPPTPKAPTSGSPSALSLSEAQYKQAKHDIAYGKIPALNANSFIPV